MIMGIDLSVATIGDNDELLMAEHVEVCKRGTRHRHRHIHIDRDRHREWATRARTHRERQREKRR